MKLKSGSRELVWFNSFYYIIKDMSVSGITIYSGYVITGDEYMDSRDTLQGMIDCLTL